MFVLIEWCDLLSFSKTTLGRFNFLWSMICWLCQNRKGLMMLRFSLHLDDGQNYKWVYHRGSSGLAVSLDIYTHKEATMSSICEKEGSGYNRQTMLRLIGRMLKGIILISLHFHNYMTGDINTQQVGYSLTNHKHKWGFFCQARLSGKKSYP